VLLGAVVSAIGLIALVGYIGGYEAGYGWGQLTRIAIHSTLVMIVLGLGISLLGWFTRVFGEMEVHHLRNAILLYATGGIVLTVMASSALALLPIQQQLRQRRLDHINQVVETKTTAIKQYRLRVQDIASQIASRTRARLLLTQLNQKQMSHEQYVAATQPLLLDAMQPQRYLAGLVRLDAQGQVAVSLGDTIDPKHWPLYPTETQTTTIAGPWLIGDTFYVTVAAPIQSPEQRVGTDILLLNLKPIHQVINDVHGLGSDAYASLVLTRGNRVWLLNLNDSGSDYWQKIDDATSKLVRETSHGESGMRLPPLNDPEAQLLAYAAVPDSNWVVMVHVDPTSYETGKNHRLIMIYGTVLLLSLLAAYGVYLLVQPLTDGILVKADTLERHVRNATQDMETELKEYKRLDAALASQAGRLDRANAALRESQERLSLALGTAQIGAWDWSLEDKTMHWDERLHGIFGFAPNTFDGTYEAFLAAIHSEDVDRVDQAILATLNDDAQFELDFRAIVPNSKIRYLSSRATVLRDEDGKAERVLGVCLDVTERLRAQQKLEQHAQELDRLNTELGRSNQELAQFAYVASHDLQEPLRMVASYVQLLERRYKDKLDDQAFEFIAFAVDGAKRMQILINDLLDYSRVSTQGEAFAITDMNEQLSRAMANLEARIKDTEAQIALGPMPTVNADAGQMARLFQNLISNAMKFCGELTPRIDVGCVRQDNEWIISIKDNGIGIEPQYADKIFVIFQRLHTRSEYEGTGIGLAVCKRVVDRHGGRIWFDSKPGEGTTFFFSIPAIEEETS
jgi:PAS domain S-box-containing protein